HTSSAPYHWTAQERRQNRMERGLLDLVLDVSNDTPREQRAALDGLCRVGAHAALRLLCGNLVAGVTGSLALTQALVQLPLRRIGQQEPSERLRGLVVLEVILSVLVDHARVNRAARD